MFQHINPDDSYGPIMPVNASVGKNVTIHPSTVIGEDVLIGKNTTIEANCTIEKNTKVGDNCTIGQLCYIDEQTIISDNVTISGRSYVGSESNILRNCRISSRVSIGNRVTIYKECFIGMHTDINDDVEIAPHTRIGRNSTIRRGVKLLEPGSLLPDDTELTLDPVFLKIEGSIIPVLLTDDRIVIACIDLSIRDWQEVSLEQALEMDRDNGKVLFENRGTIFKASIEHQDSVAMYRRELKKGGNL
jgi:carbonic anhydrase/acetyltransferase-like protein (isoleucine patch superfamily)